jgi:hypothetical protein
MRLDNDNKKSPSHDADELQAADECNRRWVGAWKKAVKKSAKPKI